MKYSYNWLKKLSGTKKTPKQLAELLTMHAFEVEGIENAKINLGGVVVGEILKIEKHPDADKLQLAKVNVGDKKLDIVCGAPNIKEGQKVPVALVGTNLPSGIEIKEAEIRGVKSFGMLCAEDELEMGDSHEGIMVLDEKAVAGTPFVKYLGLDDAILNIDVLSNRGHDALSYVGMAREICALEGRKFSGEKDLENLKVANKKKNILNIGIKDEELCPRYIGAIIEGIKIKESSSEIKSKLISSGIKPINSVVDATNYIMLKLGQPMHAFSAEEISEIVVRKAKEGEKIILLDKTKVDLKDEDLIIANSKNPIALAGIMGGLDSGINEKTSKIILESANFNPVSIRGSRMRHGLKTDASDRFEKELDPNLAEQSMASAIKLICKITGGKLIDLVDSYSNKVSPWEIILDLESVNNLLGEEISQENIIKILSNLGLKIKKKTNEYLELEIPTFRIDLKTQEDLIEEIGRIYGYEKIKPQSLVVPVKNSKVEGIRTFERNVKNILTGSGFSEVCNYSFYSKKTVEMAGLENINHFELENPMNPDQALMRVSLIPGVLKNIHENLKNFKNFTLFESGRTYRAVDREILPKEKRMLVGSVVLENGSSKDETGKAESFFETKGQVDNLLSKLGITGYYYKEAEKNSDDKSRPLWHGGRRAEIKLEGANEAIGYVGEINPLVLIEFDIHKRVAMFEFDLELLSKVAETEREYEPLRRFPTVVRDISMITDKDTRVSEILNEIQQIGKELVLDVDLFDIYQDPEKNEKSFAFHIIFGANERTLESKEVDDIMEKIMKNLEENLGVSVRR